MRLPVKGAQGLHQLLSNFRSGAREILWTDPLGNFGNFAYVWLQAHRRQGRGTDCNALITPAQLPWLELFPAAQGLVTQRRDVGLRDQRINGTHQEYQRDFTRTDLERFIRDVIFPGLAPGGNDPRRNSPDRLVINVRRGDYYTKEWRGEFGFDIDAYLHEVMDDAALRNLSFSEIVVVSDGIDWCRARLGWLQDHTRYLTYFTNPLRAGGTGGAVAALADFREIASASNLVLTNSTFSYWGAYVSEVLHLGSSNIWAPRFHQRSLEKHGKYIIPQASPNWTVIPSIPGGWDS